MATPVEQLSFKPTGTTTARTLGAYSSDVLNVKNFGATGDNSTDDYAAIQACLDAAFGTEASPHGNGGGHLNPPVYIPRGRYNVTSPLKINAVFSGKIFGDGPLSSIITYTGQIATPPTADNIIPTLWINGGNYMEISDIQFKGKGDPTNNYTASIWLGPDGIASSSAHSNLFRNVFTASGAIGVVAGSIGSAANSENLFLNCNVAQHGYRGYWFSGSNTLNCAIISGGIDSIGSVANFTAGFGASDGEFDTGLGCAGVKVTNNATVPFISNVALADNYLDFDFSGAILKHVLIGVRTESPNFIHAWGGSVSVIGCESSSPGDNAVTASVVGSTNIMTVTAITDTNLRLRPGMVVFGAGVDAHPYVRILEQLTSTEGGGALRGKGTYQLTGNAIDSGSGTKRVCPVFVYGGSTVVDGCRSAYNPAFLGPNNASLRIRSNNFWDGRTALPSADLITGFGGPILEYDLDSIADTGNYTVALLPTAAANLKGVRMWVRDSSVTTFGSTVAAGGSTTVPVYCDGTNWKVG